LALFISKQVKTATHQTTHLETATMDPASKAILVGLGIVTLLSLSIIPALSRSMTSLVATETTIVETGCRLRAGYVETYDRRKLKIVYRYSRGENEYDELYFIQKGKRRLHLRIDGSSHVSNFIVIAPEAMREYADQLRSEGKVLPHGLTNIVSR